VLLSLLLSQTGACGSKTIDGLDIICARPQDDLGPSTCSSGICECNTANASLVLTPSIDSATKTPFISSLCKCNAGFIGRTFRDTNGIGSLKCIGELRTLHACDNLNSFMLSLSLIDIQSDSHFASFVVCVGAMCACFNSLRCVRQVHW
jgi:hypothetical protein